MNSIRFIRWGLLALVTMTVLAFTGNTVLAGEVIQLRYASYQPTTSQLYKCQQWWGEQLEKRSGGKVRVKLFPGQQLAKAKQMLEAISGGLTDIGGVSPSYTPAKLALHTIDFLPTLAPVRADQQMLILNGPLRKNPAIVKELEALNVVNLFTLCLPGYSVISVKPVREPADFKGLKIRCTGMLAPFFKALGAVPVFTPAPEAMMAMSRGVVDAVAGCGDYWHKAYKLDEVGKYLTRDVAFGGATLDILMNKNSYDKLPADVKKIINDLRQEMAQVNQLFIASPSILLKWHMENERKGITYVYWKPADVKTLDKIAKPFWEKWMQKWAKKDAKEYFEAYIKAKDEVLKKYPNGIPVQYKF